MGVDNRSTGFDASHALIDDFLGQNRNSGLDPTRRGAVEGDFNACLLLRHVALPRWWWVYQRLNHGTARQGKAVVKQRMTGWKTCPTDFQSQSDAV
jgi:hypothetical protein